MSAPVAPRREVPAETRASQRAATDPGASAWVSANAGSGKTYVLSRRVIRLLLAGVDPGRILCLTFTKAAAAEMANRVFEVLGAWAVAPDAELAAEIAALEDRQPDARRLAAARRLFAKALETPGGLKIQTIHGFCEALLQRFPVEAGIPGRFTVLDEHAAEARLTDARAAAVITAATHPTSPIGRAFALLLPAVGDDEIEKALTGIVAARDRFARWRARYPDLGAAFAALETELGVAGVTPAHVTAEMAESQHLPDGHLAELVAGLAAGSALDQGVAARAAAVLAATGPDARAAARLALVLTAKDEPRKADKFATKAALARFPDLEGRVVAEQDRLMALAERRAAAVTAERTAAIATIAAHVVDRYEAGKLSAGVLDFEDLIVRSAALLSASDAAAWVHYKLDQGIDHVLVDEAQDTSPRAWEVVAVLTGEFFAGEGARPGVRTVFAVGDEKQSIYSFQGAAPHLFDAERRRLRKVATEVGAGFNEIRLQLSFRSVADVVRAVDTIFAAPDAHAGLAAGGGAPVHETIRSSEAGHVELWDETEPATDAEPENWYDPLDEIAAESAESRLARRIARTVRGWIDAAAPVGDRAGGTRPMRAGDVLVLVRKRGAFLEAMTRAFQEAGVPVAGADRLDVLRHIAVLDLIALARVALTPEDELSLAALLKSPLIGLDEAALYRIAHGRRRGLFEALRTAADTDADAHLAFSRLARWRAHADTVDAYGFFAAVLAEGGGRRAFRARLGDEVDDILDAFLDLVRDVGRDRVPTLEAVLAFAAASRHEVKREVDRRRNEARIMTVHGAKGLEAPVVFLVDPGSAPASASHRPALLPLHADDETAAMVWVQKKPYPPVVDAAVAAYRQRAEEEYRRLLYVGLTRAEDRLVVCGIKPGKASPGRWHTLVAAALTADPARLEPLFGEGGEQNGWRWRTAAPAAEAPTPAVAAADVADLPPLPDWLRRPAPQVPAEAVLNPSAAEAALAEIEAKDRPEPYPARHALDAARAGDGAALVRGKLLHRLLEMLPGLPPDGRATAAARFLARAGAGLAAAVRENLAAEALAVLDHPDFAPVFAPGGRGEVPIAGRLMLATGRPVAVSGQIDRLAVTDDRVLIVDFKTNRPAPDGVPEPYRLQLAVYAALLARLYPGRRIEAAVLWTDAPRLEPVDPELLAADIARLFQAGA
ncbi:double-strand break repair helicase AddA [Methylobrevis albus]|uniref:DNA 3'-5' helicase n=1 Tax=Methylobrevis albus TaxID=2793297 RepID=A0A931I3X9_9HYPH|nr:double-strand break repair helicase AddA [Methylobrevis albus]MBH0238848.1 double-strand break repair helicase AddA [Methylobrevis albus]